MIDFFQTHQKAFLFIVVTIGFVVLFIFLTNLFYKIIKKKFLKKYPDEIPTTIKLVKRVLNILWVVLGICAISFVFIDQDLYAEAMKNVGLAIYLAIVTILTIIGASLVNTLFARAIKKQIIRGDDPTSYKFLSYLVVFSVYFVGIILVILGFPSLRGIAQTALGGAGVLALVAGVASQEALANLVGGIFIISFKPFRIGDIIKVTETMVGTVTDITLRHTVIRNYQNKMIVIPNAILNKEKIVNYDLGERKTCQWVELGISYNSDIDLAKKIIQEECEVHPSCIDNRSHVEKNEGIPKVIVRVLSLDDSSVTIRAWTWAWHYTSAFVMRCELLESIKKADV